MHVPSKQEKKEDLQQQATYSQIHFHSQFFLHIDMEGGLSDCLCMLFPFSILAADQKSYFRMMDEIVMQIGRKRASERASERT